MTDFLRTARGLYRAASPLERIVGGAVLGLGAYWLASRARAALGGADKLPNTGAPTKGRGQTAHLSDDFFRSVEGLAAELRAKGAKIEAEDILAVFLSESGIRATSKNSLGFGGLNGMGTPARKALGAPESIDAWTKMSPDAQLPFVRAFILSQLRSFAGGSASVLTGPGRLYLLNFTPAFIKKPDDFVISRRGQSIYDANQAMDVDRDGVIDPADVRNFLFKNVAASKGYWNEVLGRLETARTTPPDLPNAA